MHDRQGNPLRQFGQSVELGQVYVSQIALWFKVVQV